MLRARRFPSSIHSNPLTTSLPGLRRHPRHDRHHFFLRNTAFSSLFSNTNTAAATPTIVSPHPPQFSGRSSSSSLCPHLLSLWAASHCTTTATTTPITTMTIDDLSHTHRSAHKIFWDALFRYYRDTPRWLRFSDFLKALKWKRDTLREADRRHFDFPPGAEMPPDLKRYVLRGRSNADQPPTEVSHPFADFDRHFDDWIASALPLSAKTVMAVPAIAMSPTPPATTAIAASTTVVAAAAATALTPFTTVHSPQPLPSAMVLATSVRSYASTPTLRASAGSDDGSSVSPAISSSATIVDDVVTALDRDRARAFTEAFIQQQQQLPPPSTSSPRRQAAPKSALSGPADADGGSAVLIPAATAASRTDDDLFFCPFQRHVCCAKTERAYVSLLNEFGIFQESEPAQAPAGPRSPRGEDGRPPPLGGHAQKSPSFELHLRCPAALLEREGEIRKRMAAIEAALPQYTAATVGSNSGKSSASKKKRNKDDAKNSSSSASPSSSSQTSSSALLSSPTAPTLSTASSATPEQAPMVSVVHAHNRPPSATPPSAVGGPPPMMPGGAGAGATLSTTISLSSPQYDLGPLQQHVSAGLPLPQQPQGNGCHTRHPRKVVVNVAPPIGARTGAGVALAAAAVPVPAAIPPAASAAAATAVPAEGSSSGLTRVVRIDRGPGREPLMVVTPAVSGDRLRHILNPQRAPFDRVAVIPPPPPPTITKTATTTVSAPGAEPTTVGHQQAAEKALIHTFEMTMLRRELTVLRALAGILKQHRRECRQRRDADTAAASADATKTAANPSTSADLARLFTEFVNEAHGRHTRGASRRSSPERKEEGSTPLPAQALEAPPQEPPQPQPDNTQQGADQLPTAPSQQSATAAPAASGGPTATRRAVDDALGTFATSFDLSLLQEQTSQLNAQQAAVLAMAQQGHSLFLSGDAGTGKSFLLRTVIGHLRDRLGLSVAVTGSTGIAAQNIGGVTFHSVFNFSKDSHAARYVQPAVAAFLCRLDVLVIDEISMVPEHLLAGLNAAARIARLSKKPFGGIQVILCGDFLQLAPVEPSPTPLYASPLLCDGLVHARLTQVMRQTSDPEFLAALNELRVGKLPAMIAESATANPPSANALRLFARRYDAKAHNTAMMAQIAAPVVAFPSSLIVKGPPRGEDLSDVATFYTPDAGTGPTAATLQSRIAELTHFAPDDIFVVRMRRPFDRPSDPSRWAVRLRGNRRDAATIALRMAVHGLAVSGVLADAHVHVHATESRAVEQEMLRRLRTGGTFTKDSTLATKELKEGCRVMLLRNLTPTLVNGLVGRIVRFGVMDPKAEEFEPIRHLFRVREQPQSTPPKQDNGGQKGSDASDDHKAPAPKESAATLPLDEGKTDSVASDGTIGTSYGWPTPDEAAATLPTAPTSPMPHLSLDPPPLQQDTTRDEPAPLDLDTDDNKTTTAALIPRTLLLPRHLTASLVPIVQFDNGLCSYIPYVQLPMPQCATRTANLRVRVDTMPLAPAYAFTVHKVQGLTISDPVVVDCRGMWPCEHIVYVAASRVRARHQLRIIGLEPSHVVVDEQARIFTETRPIATDIHQALADLDPDERRARFPEADWVAGAE